MPKATVIIPTHDHASTLPMTIASVQRQYEQDFEVVIIGDGVTDELRQVARECEKSDSRITFLDLPKGPHHGDTYRDAVIRESKSENIFYLCDDDLLLRSHLSNLLQLLETKDFVQSRNGYIHVDQSIHIFPTDLSKPEFIEWHLREPHRNAVSLTGTAHRKSTYSELPVGWESPAGNEWTDHFMWKKFFRLPGLKAATHPEMTAIQLPTSIERESVGLAERAAELKIWFDRFSKEEAEVNFQQEVALATSNQLNYVYARATDLLIDLVALESKCDELQNENDLLKSQRKSLP
ncbi:MAG: glycosyltransferase [Actinomycetes bacterium]